jgi:hypothetical protein
MASTKEGSVMATRVSFFCVVFALWAAAGAAGAPPSRLSAGLLREQIGKCQTAIDSLEVELRSDDYQDEHSKAIRKYVITIIAAQAPSSLLHIKSHGTDRMDWRKDPEMQRAVIANGRGLKINDLNRTYVELPVKDDATLPGTLPQDFFWAATGIYPLTGRPAPQRPDGGPIALTEISVDEAFNTIRPDLEEVDGRWCHVLERPGLDVLWIDVEHGCALLAREFLDSKTGLVMWRCEASGHVEVASGIWMPRELRNIHYGTDVAKKPVVALDTRHQVTRCSVNTVSDDVFKFEPPPGALQLNADELKSEQTVPGGTDLLDELADFSKSAFHDRWSAAPPEPEKTSVARHILMGVCVGVFLGCILPMARRRNTGGSSKEN